MMMMMMMMMNDSYNEFENRYFDMRVKSKIKSLIRIIYLRLK